MNTDHKKTSPSKIKKSFRFLAFWFCMIFLLPYGLFYIYTFPLRIKESYKRGVMVTFIYKGESYTISPTITCINRGPTMNEGSMELYTNWDSVIENNISKLDGKTLAELRINDYGKRRILEAFFEKKLKGHVDPICDVVLIDQDGISKVDRVMKMDGTEQFLSIGPNGIKIYPNGRVEFNKNGYEKYLKELPQKEYTNNVSNLFSLVDEQSRAYLNVKIVSIIFEEKKHIKNYEQYIPFF